MTIRPWSDYPPSPIRTEVNVSARIVFVSAALLVVSAAAHSQPQPKPPKPENVADGPKGPFKPPVTPPPPANGNLIPAPSVPLPSIPPAPPREKTVDELLAELEHLQTEKAALETREQALKAALIKKLEAQAERLKKLGVVAPAKEKEPDRVGKIIIEGNTKTPDEKILKLVELKPGQVLPYPELEAARARLAKAGFRDVTVEVLANELDAAFKDVRVKITEADKR